MEEKAEMEKRKKVLKWIAVQFWKFVSVESYALKKETAILTSWKGCFFSIAQNQFKFIVLSNFTIKCTEIYLIISIGCHSKIGEDI